MPDFDPFANQGGPAAWDPEHAGDSKKLSDELRRRIEESGDDPGSGPSTFSDDEADDEQDDGQLDEDPDHGE